MNTIVKNIIIFVGGVAIGAFGAMRFLKGKYTQMAQEELDSMREYYRRRRFDRGEKKNSIPDPVSEMTDVDYMIRARKIIDENNYVGSGSAPYIGVDLTPEEKAEAVAKGFIPKYEDPCVIPVDVFNEEHSHFDKVTLSYYTTDDTLTDENEEIIPDINTIIGDEALMCFGEGSNDPDIVYVRNGRLGVDYEVTRIHKSYQETVLGIVTKKKTGTTSKRKKGDNAES